MKWVFRVVALVVVIALCASIFLFRQVSQEGSGTVEKWIGSQFSQIANAYLKPRLSFSHLDYEYPGTVRLRDLRLTAPDPADPERDIDIISAASATVVLAEVPSIGKPIIIERISVDRPTLQAVSTSPGASEFVGFAQLLKEPDPESFFDKHRVSDVFRMRLVELSRATLVYDPRLPDTVPMRLEDVSTRLDIEPTADGWYKLATRLERAPLFDLQIAGDVNLDNFHIRSLDLGIAAQLARENDQFLPPQIQQLLAKHEVRGKLDLSVKGDVAIDDPLAAKLSAEVRLRDASVGLEGLQTPIDDMTISATVNEGKLGVPGFQLKGLALTAPDPADPAKRVVILGADSIAFTLSEMKSLLGPLVFEKITIDRPLVQAISLSPGGFEFAGFTQIIEMVTEEGATSFAPAVSKDVAAVVGKLSDFLEMRLVEVNDARVVYDPRLPDTQPMQLDGITSRLKIEPSADGSYKLATTLGRPHLFDVRVEGQLNLDTFHLAGLNVAVAATLARENDQFLPPQIQQLLIEHDVRGTLAVSVTGDVPLTDPLAGEGSTEVHLANANVAVADYQIPIDDLRLMAIYAGGTLEVPELVVEALQGELNLNATILLDDFLTTTSTLRVTEMILEDTLRADVDSDEAPKYSGRANAEVQVESLPVLTVLERVIAALPPATQPATSPTTEPAIDLTTAAAAVDDLPVGVVEVVAAVETDGDAAPVTQPATADEVEGDQGAMADGESDVDADETLPAEWGRGWLTLEEGRLVVVPVVQRFSSAVAKMNKADATKPNERVRLEFTMGRDKLRLTQIHYASNVAVARGKGTVSLERDVHLSLNGGPMEKLQSMMGGFGAAIGKATDAMSGWRVTGKLEDPKVTMELGGTTVDVAARKTGNAIGTGAKATTRGVGNVGKKLGGFLKKIGKKKQ
ncbi:MAG TPA: hypothetical protein VGN72_03415 [Tepidisphaeraceae bacterium]|jgi:hypothetical protein|nr:hypothetical protein [Tepidisphaeraceae bacterium]